MKSGLVTIIGRPNVGKSTLLNALIGEKVSIVSDRPQTTRKNILGILSKDDFQVMFLDTPGIHKPKDDLGEHMVKDAISALEDDVDLIIFIVDAKEIADEDIYIDKYVLPKYQNKKILAINKSDLVNTDPIESVRNKINISNYDEVIPISALYGTNLDKLEEAIKKYLPEGPQYYPEDVKTTEPIEDRIREIIREKVILLTYQEIPYSIAVVLEEFEERNDLFYIRAVIFVEKESQKGIIIGKNGKKLKEIGTLAREELEALLGKKVYLDLWVKVRDKWRKKARWVEELVYS
ncbi:MAG TPA: GTPase Era [bacterium]|nr:GTPase Era [bacterium]